MRVPRLRASPRIEWFEDPVALLFFDFLMKVSESSEPRNREVHQNFEASNPERMRCEKNHQVLQGTAGQITGFTKNAYDNLRQGSFVDYMNIDENSLRPPRGRPSGRRQTS
jgi:hypothetical protein